MEGKPTFFGQLRSLCTDVDSRVKSFKQDLSQGPGRNPEKYDVGLGKLKGDIQELKKQSQVIKDKLAAFSRFSGYLQGARELVEEQIAGTQKMEQYCAQYGYVIPTKVDTNTTPKIEVTTPEGDTGKDCEDSHDKGAGSLQVTPEISVSAQMVMQGKAMPLLTPARKATTASSNLFPESPAASKTPSATKTSISSNTPITPFTPGPKPFMMMEQWMATTDEDCSLSPGTSNTKSTWKSETPATGQKTEARESTQAFLHTPVDNVKQETSGCHSLLADSCNISHNIITPPEPTLSALSTQMLKQILYQRKVGSDSSKPQRTPITTPEEPVLYSQHNSFVSVKNSYEENGTPEEPVLYYKENSLEATQQKETPEEPILSYQENLPFGWKSSSVPEEPVLSYHHTTPTAAAQNYMYRRPRDPRMFSPHTEKIDEVPTTPELSDRTMSLLSFMQQAPSQPQRNHQEHAKKNHEEPEQSYRNLHGLSQPQWNHHGVSQPHRNLLGVSQLHRDHQESSQPHHHTKPRQSFSAAMNKLNQTKDDENTWDTPGTHQHWSTSSANMKDKLQGTVDLCEIEDIPPSPQLSDITQQILGQLRR